MSALSAFIALFAFIAMFAFLALPAFPSLDHLDQLFEVPFKVGSDRDESVFDLYLIAFNEVDARQGDDERFVHPREPAGGQEGFNVFQRLVADDHFFGGVNFNIIAQRFNVKDILQVYFVGFFT